MTDLLARFRRNLSELATTEVPKHLALAVSGGSDSMALLMLAKEWAEVAEVKLSVLTVDHHLRDVSREEAEYVGEVCAQLGLAHQILDWDGCNTPLGRGTSLGLDPRVSSSESQPNETLGSSPRGTPFGNIQARARIARYDLMTGWCHEHSIDMLLTAHHLDDQVENFFIRLSRASGLFGLLDHSVGLYNKIRIIRPLFNIPKAELQAYLKKRGVIWYEDASNKDPKYLRSSVRKWLADMPGELEPDLFKARLLQTQQHLRSAASYIEKALDREIEEKVNFHEDFAEYRMSQDELISHMTLSNLLAKIGRGLEPPRSEAVARLRAQLLSDGKRATLHGCVVEMRSDGIVVINREKGRKKA